MQRWKIGSALAVCWAVQAVAASPAHAQTRSFNVPRQSAATGIPELARQADIQILVGERLVRNKSTQAVRGTMTVEDAMRQLLRGTGLQASRAGGGIFTLVAARREPSAVKPK